MVDYIKQVSVTGDVSTIDGLLGVWCEEVAKEIWEQKPEFAVLHVQGLLSAGRHANQFSEKLLRGVARDPKIVEQFPSSRAFFDTKGTGLGSLYLFRSPSEVEYYDRYTNEGYQALRGGSHQHEIGVAEADGFISNTFGEDFRFEKDFYRTGYLLARFRIFGREFTFVNVNLHSVPFEDINEIAEQPSVTKAAAKRERQIELLLHELESEGLREDSILVAGAFNAQLHETDLLNRANVSTRTRADGRLEAIEQFDRHGREVVTVEEHRFDLHTIHDWFFKLGRGQMVKKYNGELAQLAFRGRLQEESVFFQPSRHYGVNEESRKEEFQKTRCPAWADRILYNDVLSALFRHDSFCASGLYYGLVAENAVVGEHKPVSLHATICLK